MLTFLIVLTVIIGLAVLIGRGTEGSTGIIDRDAQRMDAELSAIAGYAGLHPPRPPVTIDAECRPTDQLGPRRRPL